MNTTDTKNMDDTPRHWCVRLCVPPSGDGLMIRIDASNGKRLYWSEIYMNTDWAVKLAHTTAKSLGCSLIDERRRRRTL